MRTKGEVVGLASGQRHECCPGPEPDGLGGARKEVQSQGFVIQVHVNSVPTKGELEADSRQPWRKPWREGDLRGVEAQTGEGPGDEVDGAGHRSEVDAFAGCSPLGVVKVGDESFSEQGPRPGFVESGKD